MSGDPADLTAQQAAALREALAALADELARSLADSEGAAKPVDLDQPIGRVSRMDAIQQQEMVQAGRAAMTLRAQQVRAALDRFEADTYGVCVSCEENVGHARLSARPETPLCIGCQARRERRS